MKSGLTANDSQSIRQAPQLMQLPLESALPSTRWKRDTLASAAEAVLFSSHGLTRRVLFPERLHIPDEIANDRHRRRRLNAGLAVFREVGEFALAGEVRVPVDPHRARAADRAAARASNGHRLILILANRDQRIEDDGVFRKIDGVRLIAARRRGRSHGARIRLALARRCPRTCLRDCSVRPRS